MAWKTFVVVVPVEVLFFLGGGVTLTFARFSWMSYIFILTFVTRQKVNFLIFTVNFTTLIISKALKLQVCLLWLLSLGALLVVQGNQAWNCDVLLFGWCMSSAMLAFIIFHRVYFIYLVMYVET